MSAGAIMAPYYRRYDLPWERSEEERQRLKKIFRSIAGVMFVLAVVMPFLPTSQIDRNSAIDVPPRLAKLMIERKAPPPPPPVEIVKPKEEAPVDEPKPEPRVEKKPEPKPQPKPEPKLAFVPEPVETPPINQARERAAKAGLVAMADQLAELRDTSSIDSALNNRSLNNTVGASDRSERSLLTSSSGRASSGINTASLSRNTGGGGLAGRNVTQVESPVAAAASRGAGAGAAGGRESFGSRQRSREEIELIFDKNKAAIYALYRRALRADPTLQGKLVLELTITPAGQVTDCRIMSSELSAPDFEQKLVKRVKLFNFGEQDVETVTTTKPIDFFPV